MISASELDELKDRLQSLVVSDLPATFLVLKEKIPQYSPVFERVLNLEGQYNELEKKRIEKTITQESEEVSTNRIRSSVIELVAGLEVADFSRLRAIGGWLLRGITLLLGLLLLGGAVFFGLRGDLFGSPLPDEEFAIIPEHSTGYLLYHVPTQMQLGRETECTVRIAFDSLKLLQEMVRESATVEAIETSDRMRVELVNTSVSNPAFNIQPIFPGQEEQFIQNERFSEWSFSVKPLLLGEHSLRIVVTVLKRDGGEFVPSKISFAESVEILSVTPADSLVAFRFSGEVISAKSAEAFAAEVAEQRVLYEEEVIKNEIREEYEREIAERLTTYFAFNSTRIVNIDRVLPVIEVLENYLAREPKSLLLTGHTDSIGNPDVNYQLGLDRANRVKALLTKRGIDPELIEVASVGESSPAQSNDSAEGRQKNRRVTIRFAW
ncbi:OmpA family protein [Lewinella sp. W8]|uniref:OmpA family protein n=1 Tax=Lewinella sp. W8 TaxID=2528208 RepID=UPI0010672CB2|nr:OmpA family protein [Lewinella sp. W8]MTB52109.1 OmpA family protein [Lewinella sp. W8]